MYIVEIHASSNRWIFCPSFVLSYSIRRVLLPRVLRSHSLSYLAVAPMFLSLALVLRHFHPAPLLSPSMSLARPSLFVIPSLSLSLSFLLLRIFVSSSHSFLYFFLNSPLSISLSRSRLLLFYVPLSFWTSAPLRFCPSVFVSFLHSALIVSPHLRAFSLLSYYSFQISSLLLSLCYIFLTSAFFTFRSFFLYHR